MVLGKAAKLGPEFDSIMGSTDYIYKEKRLHQVSRFSELVSLEFITPQH